MANKYKLYNVVHAYLCRLYNKSNRSLLYTKRYSLSLFNRRTHINRVFYLLQTLSNSYWANTKKII